MPGKKAAGKKKEYYKRQFAKTRANKIRRLRKRLKFDPQAEKQIKALQSKI